jgi:hypothetical protein
MSDDLVAQLRAGVQQQEGPYVDVMAEAADRIEHLEAEREVTASALAETKKHNASLLDSLLQKPYPSDLFIAEEERDAEQALADQLAEALEVLIDAVHKVPAYPDELKPAFAALAAHRERREGEILSW